MAQDWAIDLIYKFTKSIRVGKTYTPSILTYSSFKTYIIIIGA